MSKYIISRYVFMDVWCVGNARVLIYARLSMCAYIHVCMPRGSVFCHDSKCYSILQDNVLHVANW